MGQPGCSYRLTEPGQLDKRRTAGLSEQQQQHCQPRLSSLLRPDSLLRLALNSILVYVWVPAWTVRVMRVCMIFDVDSSTVDCLLAGVEMCDVGCMQYSVLSGDSCLHGCMCVWSDECWWWVSNVDGVCCNVMTHSRGVMPQCNCSTVWERHGVHWWQCPATTSLTTTSTGTHCTLSACLSDLSSITSLI